MPENHIFAPGDVIRLKKPHPCGGWDWELLRVGMDFRLRCLNCNHLVMLPRTEVERRIKALVKKAENPPDESGQV